jgi:UDP-2,3-diacylglucosamine pyrophosphatase LpxH
MTDPIASSDLPPRILVVSDLHILTGSDPVTGRINARENFLADDAFSRFLKSQRAEVSQGEPLLVINGDAFDFIRITDVPRTDEDFARWDADLADLGYRPKRPLRHTMVRKEYRDGLRTDHYKTVWKFRRIVRGHPAFFAALGDWVASGGRIVFMKGNHDLEFHWPLLHQAIRFELAKQAGGRADGAAIEFHENGLQIHNVYIEHGHRFEAMTRVDGPPTVFDGREIRFPFGSFFNKYVINHLEDLDPFLDNVKPTRKVIEVAIRRRPFAVLRILGHGIRALRGTLVRESPRHGLALVLLLLILGLPILTLTLVILTFLFQPVRGTIDSLIGSETLRRVLVVLGTVAPWVIAGFHELFRKKTFEHGEDEYAEGVYQELPGRAGSFQRMYAVMGHTHRMDIQDLGAIGDTHCFYLNCGSWTPQWDEQRPDLNGRLAYSFIRLDLENGEYRHRLMEWRDDRGEAVPAVIYAPSAPGRRPSTAAGAR